MDMQTLRQEIDAIDDALVQLLCQRLDVSEKIGQYKREHALPVRDEGREAALLSRVADRAGMPYAPHLQAIYAAILETSRAYQQAIAEA